MTYSENIEGCRNQYPFNDWLEDYDEGIGHYSQECCLMVQNIFDGLIDSLVELGFGGPKETKLKLFEVAVKRLNLISNSQPKLIETMEREEFCDLFDSIALVAGLDPVKDGSSDGIASKWRTW